MSKKKTIMRYVDKWSLRLGLRWWHTVIHWSKKKLNKSKSKTVVARCYSDWRYTILDLHVYLPAFKYMSKDETETVVLHELCHAMVNEMREGAIHHEERVVTGLTKAFLWTEMETKKETNEK